jgi:hypothetical protein
MEQPAPTMEAEIDRSIENVNNQLNRNFNVSLRRESPEEPMQSSLL